MATPLRTSFSSDEKIVSHTDTKAIGSFAEMLVIEFDQAKFEEFISENKISSTVRSCHRIRRSVNLGSKMTSACVKPTFAEGSLSLAGSQTNLAKSEGAPTLVSSEDQDVITSDLGLQSSTPIGVRFKASHDARYASSIEAKNGGNPSFKFPQRNNNLAGKSSQRRRKRRSHTKIIGEVGTHTDLRELISLKRARQCQHCATLKEVISTVQKSCQHKTSIFKRLSHIPEPSEVRIKRRRRVRKDKAQVFTVNMTSVTSRDERESDESSPEPIYSPGIGSICLEPECVYRNTRLRQRTAAIPFDYSTLQAQAPQPSSLPRDANSAIASNPTPSSSQERQWEVDATDREDILLQMAMQKKESDDHIARLEEMVKQLLLHSNPRASSLKGKKLVNEDLSDEGRHDD